MPFPSEVFLFLLLIICGVLVAKERNLFAAAMLTGLFSLTSACLFTLMDAVDVAFTEAAVGAGISTVLVLATLGLTGREENQRPASIFPFIVCLLTGTALAVGIMSMEPYGNDNAPIHRHVAADIQKVEWAAVQATTQGHPETAACTETKECTGKNEECLAGHCSVRAVGLPNLVTSILGSYRGYDTLGETGVIFTAGVGVMLLLVGRRKETEEPEAEADTPEDIPEIEASDTDDEVLADSDETSSDDDTSMDSADEEEQV